MRRSRATPCDHPVASLTFIDPVSPHGYGGTFPDGTPCFPDGAGSGGGTANPEVVRRLAAGDASDESPASIRNVMNAFYWAPSHREPPEREDLLVAEILKTVTGADNYPGDSIAVGELAGHGAGPHRDPERAVPALLRLDRASSTSTRSRRCCGRTAPPTWWSPTARRWSSARSARPGTVPDWPGPDVFPPQPMVTQIRELLERYAAAGGRVRTEMFDGSGHGPHFDARDRWLAVFTDFLASC